MGRLPPRAGGRCATGAQTKIPRRAERRVRVTAGRCDTVVGEAKAVHQDAGLLELVHGFRLRGDYRDGPFLGRDVCCEFDDLDVPGNY